MPARVHGDRNRGAEKPHLAWYALLLATMVCIGPCMMEKSPLTFPIVRPPSTGIGSFTVVDDGCVTKDEEGVNFFLDEVCQFLPCSLQSFLINLADTGLI